METWKINVNKKELIGAEVITTSLSTEEDVIKSKQIQTLTFNKSGECIKTEVDNRWGENYLTFPPVFNNINEVAKWSNHLLKDVYGYGDIIKQQICITKRFK